MLQLCLVLLIGNPLRRNGLQRNGAEQGLIQTDQIPVVLILIVANQAVYHIFNGIGEHLIDGVTHTLAIQYPAALRVDDLTLLIHNLVILQQILTNTEVVALNLLLSLLDGIGKHLMLNLLIFRHAQGVENAHQTLGSEEAHQIVLQRNVETGFSRISLTSGTSSQLIVNTAGLVALGTDNLQSACFLRVLVQLNIRTTARHVGSDGNCAMLSGKGYDLCLTLMELRVQYLMGNALLAKQSA